MRHVLLDVAPSMLTLHFRVLRAADIIRQHYAEWAIQDSNLGPLPYQGTPGVEGGRSNQ